MKPVLLDTHVFLWFLYDDPRLSPLAAQRIEALGSAVRVSIVTFWEIAIKHQLGKLGLGMPFDVFVERSVGQHQVEVAELTLAQIVVYDSLPLHHRDPFDRLIIAQARQLESPVITGDARFSAYDNEVIW